MTVHRVDLTGDYETTVYDVARCLLDRGADPDGLVEDLARWRLIDVRRHWRAGEVAG